MPKLGLSHNLLSGRHPDTSPPAGGADPDDGQVPTWSDALGAWQAQTPTPGVTDHGALTGLYPDDDHAQYALADKSRPTTWVAAADLSPRSLADLGTKSHALLTDKGADDHTQYVLALGRLGGQTIRGGTTASEDLVLESTAHATKGVIRSEDDLQLSSNIIRDSGGTARATLATSSPEVTLTGDVVGSNHLALGGAAIHTGRVLNIAKTLATTPAAQGISASVYGLAATGVQAVAGVAGGIQIQGTPTLGIGVGLDYTAQQNSSSACFLLAGIRTAISSGASGGGAITTACGLYQQAAAWTNVKPTTVRAISIEEQGAAGVGTLEVLKVVDQTATTVRLMEYGPAVPYLRLVGGANPAANQTNLYLKEQATLRQVQWKDGAAIGGGDRVMILV